MKRFCSGSRIFGLEELQAKEKKQKSQIMTANLRDFEADGQ